MQTSGITKEIRSFLFYSRVQLILFKDNAIKWNNKRNDTKKNTYSRVKPCDYRCLPMRLFIFANSTTRISSFDYSSFYSFIVIALPL